MLAIWGYQVVLGIAGMSSNGEIVLSDAINRLSYLFISAFSIRPIAAINGVLGAGASFSITLVCFLETDAARGDWYRVPTFFTMAYVNRLYDPATLTPPCV